MKSPARIERYSAASFVVPKSNLSYEDGNALLAYNLSEENIDGWVIYEDGDRIRGFTQSDNDALDEYLEKINFDCRKMIWENI